MSLDHFVLQFIGMFEGVGGVACVNIVGICKVSAIAIICCVSSSHPMDEFCGVCRAMNSIAFCTRFNRNFGGIVGSS